MNTAAAVMPIDPNAAFDADVPAGIREDVFQEMSDAVSSGESMGRVTIIDHDRIDAVNCRASGIVTIDGTEFQFELEDGNRNGTVLVSWNEDRPFERTERTEWALQPLPDAIGSAIESGRGAVLVMKWDAVLKFRPEVADIARKYAYDRHFAPGVVTETHWRAAAAKAHLAIVTKEEADRTRERLLAAGPPHGGGVQEV